MPDLTTTSPWLVTGLWLHPASALLNMRPLLILGLALGLVLAPASPAPAWLGSAPPPKECADGIDNDNDGLTDHPADPDCRSVNDPREQRDDTDPPPAPRCADGVDNDADSKVDFPADPGCTSATDDDETDAPNPRCADGVDNDGDGNIDFPGDPGCSSSADNDETDAAGQVAGASVDGGSSSSSPVASNGAVVAAGTVGAPVTVFEPRPLSPFPIVRLRGVLTRAGIKVQLLSIRAPAGAVVTLRCRGERCPLVRRRAVSQGRTISFRRLGRRALVGVTLQIRVVKPGYVGKFVSFRLRAGRFPLRRDACLMPGRSAPSACP